MKLGYSTFGEKNGYSDAIKLQRVNCVKFYTK